MINKALLDVAVKYLDNNKIVYSSLSCDTRMTMKNYNNYFIDDGTYAIVYQKCSNGADIIVPKTICTLIIARTHKPFFVAMEDLGILVTWNGYDMRQTPLVLGEMSLDTLLLKQGFKMDKLGGIGR